MNLSKRLVAIAFAFALQQGVGDSDETHVGEGAAQKKRFVFGKPAELRISQARNCYYSIVPVAVEDAATNTHSYAVSIEFVPKTPDGLQAVASLCGFTLPCGSFKEDFQIEGQQESAAEHLSAKSGTWMKCRQLILKFQDWAAAAHRENVKSFEKPLGDEFVFVVKNDGRAFINAPSNLYDKWNDEVDVEFVLFAMDSGEIEKAVMQIADKQRATLLEEKKVDELFK